MNRFHRYINSIVFLFLNNHFLLCAYAPIGGSCAHDSIWRSEHWLSQKKLSPFKIGLNYEHGFAYRGFDKDTERSNILALYESTQSAIPMLSDEKGIDILNEADLPVDDGTRGHFKVEGEFHEVNYSLFSSYAFVFRSVPGFFDVSAYLPFRHMKFSNINWIDLTTDNVPADFSTKEKITSNIFNLASERGGLSLKEVERQGIGDVTIMGRWQHDFLQVKKNIASVRVQGRIGAMLPTAKRRNQDEAFSLPLGNDGAFGIPIGGQLEVLFQNRGILGLDVECLKLYDTNQVQRLKTNVNQTEFLLLSKGEVRKKYGSTWRFNLYAGSKYFFSGCSAQIMYQYILHNYDKLYARSNAFNHSVINSLESLKEWNLHNLIIRGSYDCCKNAPDFFFKPQLIAFCKIPLGGRRSIGGFTVGGSLVINF